jgi:hypothetical protein
MKLREIRVTGTLAASLAAVALTGCVGPTYGTGKTAGETIISDLDGMLALGSTNKEAISYNPRAELVRPKDTSVLPPPREGVNAANDPNWPESPEVRSARIKAAADARDTGGTVSPDVLLARKEGIGDDQIARNTNGGNSRISNDRGRTTLSPQELDSSREAFKQRLKDSKQGSPTNRKYLSEPPVAYRQPAASAPVGDPGIDEKVKEARLTKKKGIGESLRSILPF